ncbi:cache domain-containing sensor histidine kinase [Paenibacillus thalictri]|uniref:histidine kinase n=1 Tax=Paenibacillus thalictri TaxID=2527873 RepID=A0A4Q9DQL5_9BACL|nr:sensor histidine kinase [Paenibacillus thalictri]TBL76606.1 sensor histidine kinase [Paenibacillus thalictri]
MLRSVMRAWSYLSMLFKGVVAARRWLVAYLVLILIPASLFMYMYSQKYSQILEDEVTHTMLQTLKQAEINLNYQFDTVRDVSNTILMYPKLHEYLRDSASFVDQLDAMKELRHMADNAESNSSVFRVRLFVEGTKLFSNEKINLFNWDTIKGDRWYPEVLNAGGLLVWEGLHAENYIDKGEMYVFSGARILRDPENFNHLSGVLLIDVTEKTIDDILSKIELNKDKQQKVMMVAPDGTIMLHRDKSLLGTKLKSAAALQGINSAAEGIIPISEDQTELYAVFTTMRSTGWKLVAEVPKTVINARADSLNQFSSVATLLGVTVLFCILVFILLAFIVQGMNRRVKTVIKSIKQEGISWLEERGGTAEGDFNLLEKTVDSLIHRVRDLMEETYKSKVQEREAQLRALQAQINPHFLYNTLDTINWIAIGRNAHDISQMIDSLAKYFRLSLNKGKDFVSVGDELNLAKVYLELQQSRFPKSFEFVLEAGAGVEQEEMPKLTLQPIVENALIHGIRKSKGKTGTIVIRADMEQGDLVLSVKDDGIGMEPELARLLLTEPRPETPSFDTGSSYGLYNVNERIKLYAGEMYGLEIRSSPGQGTTVIVRLRGGGSETG